MHTLSRFLLLLGLGAPLAGFAGTTVTNTTYSSGQSATVFDPDTIATSGTVTVSSGANITFKAQTTISLEPGFTAASGSFFQAQIVDLKPAFTSGTSSRGTVASGFNFQVVASGSPTSYTASGLPAGLSINSSTGLISGTSTTAGTFTVTVTATNAYGSRTQTITVTIASGITCNGSVSPKAIFSTQAVTLSLDGSVASGVGLQYAQYTIWRPDGTIARHVYSTPLGSAQYTPDGGNGVYWMQLRIVDNYGNYLDQWVNFFVEPVSSVLPYRASYEASDGYIVEENLYPQDGWLVQQGIARIVTAQSYDGNASVILAPGNQAPGSLIAQVQKFFTSSASEAFVDVYVKPVAAATVADSSRIDNGPSRIGFTVIGGQGAVWAYNGNGLGSGTWIDTNVRFAINGSNQATSWLRVTTHHDYSAKKWHLIVNGARAATDYGMVSNTAVSLTDITWWGSTSAAAYADDFTATTANPFPAPSFSSITPSNVSWTTFRLDWVAPGAVLHQLKFGPANVNPDTLNASSQTGVFKVFSGLTPNTAYKVWIRAQNSAGYWSGWSTTNVTTPADTTPPAPAPVLSLSSRTHNTVSLVWTASSDNVAVAGYKIYRNGGPTEIAAVTSGLTFTDSGLTPNTPYTYTAKAYDTSGNLSVASNVLPVKTDTDPNADDDGDGMPNGWEMEHGFDKNSSADGPLDPDGDGLSNVSEYNLNTDPHLYNAGTGSTGGAVPAGWPNTNADATHAVGTTAGSINVDKSGALGYSVALWTTPGTAGMEPKMSLSYSSQSGSGIAGFGWSLGGVSAITRGPQTKAIDGQNRGVTVTSSDRFYLDGQRLIAVSGADGDNNTEYRTELNSITKVVSYSSGNGPTSFKAWTKAGLIIEFGKTDDSAVDAVGGAKISWQVNRISDTKGNYMTFTYTKTVDAANGVGMQLLDRIDYTGNDSVTPVIATYASLRFEYEDRPDWVKGYVAGTPVSSGKRLKYVKSYYDDSVARTYTLKYRTHTVQQEQRVDRSELESLVEAGSDGKSYPPLTFDYAANDYGWAQSSNYVLPYFLADNQTDRPTGAGTGFVDLNGDGLPDFVEAREGTDFSVHINNGKGWTEQSLYNSDNNTDYHFILPCSLATSMSTTITDTGARFVDVNGDGRVDIICNKTGGANDAWLNTGTGWDASATQWRVPAPIARDGTQNDDNLRSGRFLDVNGDGRVDFVAFMTNGSGTTNLAVYLNNGNGWDSTADHPEYNSMDYNLAKYKARFVDVNGDGLPDIVAYYVNGGDVLHKTWLNTGSGWSESPAYQIPVVIGANDAYNPGVEFADVNGDGLPDIIWHREYANGNHTRGVAINTGAGWLLGTQEGTTIEPDGDPIQTDELLKYYYKHYAPPSPLAKDGMEVSAGTTLLDLNADGIPDYAYNRNTSSGGYTSLYYGTWRHFAYDGADAPHNLPEFLHVQGQKNAGVDFPDLNGDGVPDMEIFRRNTGGDWVQSAWLNKSKPTNGRLIRVTNGFGVAANVTYKPLTDSTVYTKGAGTGPAGSADVVGPLYVVSSVSNDDGVGGQHVIDYSYGGLRTDLLHGNLGFATMKVTDSRTGIVTDSTYRQDYPFIGMPVTQTTKTADGTTLSSSSVTYADQTPSASTRLPYAAQSVESSYELNGSLIVTTTTRTSIDDSANVTSITVSASDGYAKTTNNQYNAENESMWLLGRLTRASVNSAATGKPPLTRTSGFTYNATTGLLESETVEPDDDKLKLKLTTTYGYDDFGNKVSVEVKGKDLTVDDESGDYVVGNLVSRTTTTKYDPKGRFPLWTKNALDQQEDYTGYDQVLGVLTSMTGANALPTSWGYDGFGRKIHEHRANGTDSDVTYRWVASAPAGTKTYTDGVTPTVKYSVENTATGTAPSLAFHDSFGRAFLGIGVNGDGAMVYQATTFDNLGRAWAKSNPYRNGDSTIYWSTTQYDLLNRPLSVQTPDDENGAQTTAFSYNGFTTTSTDPRGHVSSSTKNSQGWTVSNTRNANAADGATASTVTYSYDAMGNLTGTDAAGVGTTLAYDTRGRKVSMTDADMGTWQYRYDIFGELIWQKDAKGQIVTMGYDTLGRMTSRTEAEGTTNWTYDNASGKGVGKLATVAAPGAYAESYTYDSLGRPSSITRTIDSHDYTFATTYDGQGRPLKTEYPTVNGMNFATRNVYNALGTLREIRGYLAADDARQNDQLQGKVYWQADHYDTAGRIDSETYGNGLANERAYSAATGRLRMASIDRGRVIDAPYAIQQMIYTYDEVGNVSTRADQAVGRAESFAYDGLDRLLTHNVLTGAGGTVTVAYDAKGNIASKSDAATSYTYDPTKLHALTGVSGGPLGKQTYNYDDNGNMTDGGGRTIAWTSFNQVRSITKGAFSSTFSFGAGHERVKQVSHLETTIYVGGLFEEVTPVGTGTVTEYKHYIVSPTGRVAVYTERSNFLQDTKYFHTDGLGSITAVSDEKGAIVKRFAFDAWGKRVNPATGATITGTDAAGLRRGYTGHEQLDDLGLVHMNGRVYDPILGRFLSADPHIDGAADAQSFNRYSYVANNPLGATDPTGYFKLWKDLLKPIADFFVAANGGVLFNVIYGAATGGGWQGAAAQLGRMIGYQVGGNVGYGFASGFSDSLLNGGSIGDAFRAGVIGGAQAYGAGKIGDYYGHEIPGVSTTFSNELERAFAHGVLGGLVEEAQGGQFRHGFYAGFAGSAAGSVTGAYGPLENMPGAAGIVVRTTIAAVAGGTAAELGGGKFANGATTAAFQHLFNAERYNLLEASKRLYAETSSLRSYDDEGSSDENSLDTARRKVAGVIRWTQNQVAGPREPDLKNPFVRDALWIDLQGDVSSAIEPGNETKFVIWSSIDGGQTPAPGLHARGDWPYVQANKITSVFGPFKTTFPRNAPDRFIFFYSGVK